MKCIGIVLCFSLLFSCSCPENGCCSGMLVHSVILDLKDDLTEDQKQLVVNELMSLSSIPETCCLIVSEKADTSDPRAKGDYDLILQMSFESKENLDSYSKNEFHLNVRTKIKEYLAGVPVVYDSWVK